MGTQYQGDALAILTVEYNTHLIMSCEIPTYLYSDYRRVGIM
jgi:hypothetical protein